MKKLLLKIFSLTVCFSIICASFLTTGCTNRKNILKIYNWDDYIDESLLEAFETYYYDTYGEEIKIEYSTFDTNETMYTKISRSKRDYDLAIPSEYMAEKMYKEGLLQEIDISNIPNLFVSGEYSQDGELRYDETLNELLEERYNYFLPYLWGTMGILYNKEKMNEEDVAILEDQSAFDAWSTQTEFEITDFELASADGLWYLDPSSDNLVNHWAALWSKDYDYEIYMKNSVRDTFAAASIYANYSNLEQYIGTDELGYYVDLYMNDASNEGIKKVEDALKAQKQYLKGYEVDHGKDEMVNNDVTMLLSWSGDAVWSMIENENLGYVLPKEGSNIWADGFVIPKYAKNKLAAERFINFLFMKNEEDPWGEESDYGDSGIILMDTIGYTSPITDVMDRYYEEFLTYYLADEEGNITMSNALSILDTLFPSQTEKNRCAVMEDFGSQQDEILKMWARLGVY